MHVKLFYPMRFLQPQKQNFQNTNTKQSDSPITKMESMIAAEKLEIE